MGGLGLKTILLSLGLSIFFCAQGFCKSPASKTESEEMRKLKELSQIDNALRKISETDKPASNKKILSYASGGLTLGLLVGGLLSESHFVTQPWLLLSSVIGVSSGLLVGGVVESNQLSLYFQKIKYLRRFQRILKSTSLKSIDLHWRRKVSEIFLSLHHIILGNQLRTSLERWLFLSAVEQMLILNGQSTHEQFSRELISPVLFDGTQSIFLQALQQHDAPIIRKSFRLKEEILKILVDLSEGDSARLEYLSKMTGRTIEQLEELKTTEHSNVLKKIIWKEEKFPEAGPLFQVRMRDNSPEDIVVLYSLALPTKEIEKLKLRTQVDELQTQLPRGVWMRFPQVSDTWEFYPLSHRIPSASEKTGPLEWTDAWPLSQDVKINTLKESREGVVLFKDLFPRTSIFSCLQILRFGKNNK